MLFTARAFLIMLVVALAHPMSAHAEIMVGEVSVRATVGGMQATGGYVSIHNHGDQDDRLVGVEAAFAERAEIHTMETVDGVMKMRPLAGGLALPAMSHVVLKPGGLHMMFMGLQGPIIPGSTHSITLQFERAGGITVTATGKRPGDIAVPAHGEHSMHGDHAAHAGHDDHDDHKGHDDHKNHGDHSEHGTAHN